MAAKTEIHRDEREQRRVGDLKAGDIFETRRGAEYEVLRTRIKQTGEFNNAAGSGTERCSQIELKIRDRWDEDARPKVVCYMDHDVVLIPEDVGE